MYVAPLILLSCTQDPPPTQKTPSTADTTVTETSSTGTADTSVTAGACATAPNVLILLLDDVGNDKVAAYGEHPSAPPTPTLSQLAQQGVLFRNAWAAPVCSPSRAMLLTGRYGRRYGLGRTTDETGYVLPDDEELLPELVSRSPCGYTSIALGKWHLADWSVDEPVLDAPLRQGFASHRGTIGNLVSQRLDPDPEVLGHYFRWEELHDGQTSWREGYATSATVDDTLEALEALPEPWLSYVAFHAPHGPWQPPPAALNPNKVREEDSDADRYDAILQALDTELGRLLDGIAPDVLARTTLMVIGDNGTPREVLRPPTPPTSAKNSLYEGGLNVPLIITGPSVAHPGTESDALVHLVDLFPTIAELTQARPTAQLDGLSLLPQLADPSQPGRDHVFAEQFRPNGPHPWIETEYYALRDVRFKLLRDALAGPGSDMLFDLQGRVDDGPNLLEDGTSPAEADALSQLQAQLDTLLAQVPPLIP